MHPILVKSHIKGYTRKDGVFVADHSDKRTKKPDAPAKTAASNPGYGFDQMPAALQSLVNKLTPDGSSMWEYRSMGPDKYARYPVRSGGGNEVAAMDVLADEGWTHIPDEIAKKELVFYTPGTTMFAHDGGHIAKLGHGFVSLMQHTPGMFEVERRVVQKMIAAAKGENPPFKDRVSAALSANKAAVAASKKAMASNSTEDHRAAGELHRNAASLLQTVVDLMENDQEAQDNSSPDDYEAYRSAVDGHTHDAKFHESRAVSSAPVSRGLKGS